MTSAALPAVASAVLRLVAIIEGVQKVYAVFLARNADLAPVAMPFWRRLQRASSRFQRLVEKYQAGTLRPPRPYRPSELPPGPRAPRTKKPWVRNWAWADRPDPPLPEGTPWQPVAVRLGRVQGWMTILFGWRVAVHASHLHLLIDTPEMQTFLLAAPQAARLLRTVHHMISLDPLPACLARPRRPDAVARADAVLVTDASLRTVPAEISAADARPGPPMPIAPPATSPPMAPPFGAARSPNALPTQVSADLSGSG